MKIYSLECELVCRDIIAKWLKDEGGVVFKIVGPAKRNDKTWHYKILFYVVNEEAATMIKLKCTHENITECNI